MEGNRAEELMADEPRQACFEAVPTREREEGGEEHEWDEQCVEQLQVHQLGLWRMEQILYPIANDG